MRTIPTLNALIIASLPVLGGVLAALVYELAPDLRKSVAMLLVVGFCATFVLFPGWLGNVAARSMTPSLVACLGAALPAIAIGLYAMRSRPWKGVEPTQPFSIDDRGIALTVGLFVAFLVASWVASKAAARGHPIGAFVVGALALLVLVVSVAFVGIVTTTATT